jgi:hypothetical protein
MAKKKSLTPKQRVLQKCPKAYAHEGLMSGEWYIYKTSGHCHVAVAKGATPRQAWAEAAKLL